MVEPGRLQVCQYDAWALNAGFLELQTHLLEYVIVIAFKLRQWLQKAPQCSVVHILLVLCFKYNQQDATLYSIINYCQWCTCFRRVFRPSSGTQKFTHSIGYMRSLLAATASVGELEKPPETCRALTVLKNIA